MQIKISLRLLSAFLLFILFSLSVSAQTPQPSYTRARAYDIQHYIIRVSFDRANKTIFGDTTVQLKPLRDNFKTVELDAANLKFETVVLEPENKKLEYKTKGEKVFINLDKGYSPDELISVRLKYSAKPKKGIYFVEAAVENGKIVRDAQIWSQGEAEEAHFWFPSYDFPDDKATSEEFITVDKGETAIGNGELLETIQNAVGSQTFHYKMPLAHSTYLTSFVVGNYAKTADSYKNIPLGFFLYPDKISLAPAAFGNTKNMIRAFEELTGVDFPYNKYDQTIVAKFDFGGMENVTATTFADSEILQANMGFGREIITDLVSHELAHSWFGNLVTCKNWSELWLNESFATYMEAAYREKINGRQDYLRKMHENSLEFKVSDAGDYRKRGLFFQAALPDDSLFDTQNAAITYQKGSAVIHTLRETVGTENFWNAINIYLNRHKFQNVETKDLQKAMEAASNINLDWFFSQWVYGAGYPKLEIRPVYDSKTKILKLSISQTQKSDGKTPAAFRLPMNVEITTLNGSTIQNIEIKNRREEFTISVDGEPTTIRLDTEEKIPLKSVKFLRN